MAEYNAEIYKKAFEIAVRCARELNGTPELKEAYQEAQKDNRALKSFMDFCLEKATEEASEHTVTDIVPVVRCKDCKHRKAITIIGENRVQLHCRMWYGLPCVDPDGHCYRGEKEDNGTSKCSE